MDTQTVMETAETVALCRQFYIATGIPIVLFSGKEIIYSSIGEFLDFFPSTDLPLQETAKNPEFCGTMPDIRYGRVQIEGTGLQVILGPVFSYRVDERIIRAYMHEYGIPPEYREALTEYMNALPVLTYIQFANYILMLHRILNGKLVDTDTFLEMQGNGPETPAARELQNAKKLQAQGGRSENGEEPEGKTSQGGAEDAYLRHLKYRKEKLFQLIRLGNEKALSEYLARHPGMFDAPKCSPSPVRQARDEFIMLMTEVSVSCLEASGVPPHRIREMQSAYIQKCEQLQSVEIIHWLRHGMLLDFCRQAARAKLPENVSTELLQCLQYIRENLGEKLSLEEIAGNIGRSVSYMQKLFQRELLTSPGVYIAQCRTESAKELLSGPDSLAEIAYRLGYSSQAHFQTAFKKATGTSPQQYRKNLLNL